MTENIEYRYLAACAIARDAGKLALSYFQDVTKLTVEVKGVQDLASIADREVEELIVTRLAQSFPSDGFLAEERGGAVSPDSAFWVIDPIDGTSNFIRGIPFFCVAIAYMLAGEIEIGIIYDPVADELFAARRGLGATRNGKKIQVTDCNNITKAMVTFDFNYRTTIERFLASTQQLLSAQCDTRRLGSGALAIAHVADGRSDAYWNFHHYPWDAIAGMAIAREAGGWTSNFLAGEGLTKGNEVLVCTAGIKDVMIAATGIS